MKWGKKAQLEYIKFFLLNLRTTGKLSKDKKREKKVKSKNFEAPTVEELNSLILELEMIIEEEDLTEVNKAWKSLSKKLEKILDKEKVLPDEIVDKIPIEALPEPKIWKGRDNQIYRESYFLHEGQLIVKVEILKEGGILDKIKKKLGKATWKFQRRGSTLREEKDYSGLH